MTSSIVSFADLLASAVTEPGILSAAYRQFHSYSLGNQLLAWGQCQQREIPPGRERIARARHRRVDCRGVGDVERSDPIVGVGRRDALQDGGQR